MNYSDVIILRNHFSSFIKVCEQLPQPSDPKAFNEAIKFWRASVPDSPILPILEGEKR